MGTRFLEPRKTAEKALIIVIQGAWIGGVSTRRVDELVQAMGRSGISKSQVSKLCKDIDERVNVFLDRPLDGEWPYLWLDATYLKVRDGGRIVSAAAIIAVAERHERRSHLQLQVRDGDACLEWLSIAFPFAVGPRVRILFLRERIHLSREFCGYR
jgi:putative transposase